MRMNRKTKHTSFILCMVLIVAMALSTTGCNGSTKQNAPTGTETTAETKADAESSDNTDSSRSENTVLGEGSVTFPFTVIDQDGNETVFEIHTDKETVGEALAELGLIAGEEGDYGLYVKTVNGITADYDTDGKYWAFYINGEYAATSVDSTPVAEGESYSFQVE